MSRAKASMSSAFVGLGARVMNSGIAINERRERLPDFASADRWDIDVRIRLPDFASADRWDDFESAEEPTIKNKIRICMTKAAVWCVR